MRLLPSDPDVETIVGRIEDKSIDLQPNFQRGEVWPIAKKQRLIDSILRDWHVPPIHVVVAPSNKQLVLDGQQRLVAIRDFAANKFPVDGTVPPISDELLSLNGLYFSELSPKWKRQFNQFTLRLFRITDYKPSEPGELFFRLNQPSALTAAEQRNAFFGDTREQIKTLVSLMEKGGLDDSFWGFSNARMSYDDVIARTCLVLERKSLKQKVTAVALADRYRSGKGFSAEVGDQIADAIDLLTKSKPLLNASPRFNKATAQTWLVFSACCLSSTTPRIGPKWFALFFNRFNEQRMHWPLDAEQQNPFLELDDAFGNNAGEALRHVYEDRSTSRVADISSVVLRDFVVWAHYWAFCVSLAKQRPDTGYFFDFDNFQKHGVVIDSPHDVEGLAESCDWGKLH